MSRSGWWGIEWRRKGGKRWRLYYEWLRRYREARLEVADLNNHDTRFEYRLMQYIPKDSRRG